jgi:hypothetical protein
LPYWNRRPIHILSRPQHIPQALLLSSNTPPNGSAAQKPLLRGIQSAVEMDTGRSVDEANFGSGTYPLFVAPDPALAIGHNIQAADRAKLLMQSGEWFLVTANGKIGWIHKQTT